MPCTTGFWACAWADPLGDKPRPTSARTTPSRHKLKPIKTRGLKKPDREWCAFFHKDFSLPVFRIGNKFAQ